MAGGLGVLVGVQGRARARGITLALTGLPPRVAQLLAHHRPGPPLPDRGVIQQVNRVRRRQGRPCRRLSASSEENRPRQEQEHMRCREKSSPRPRRRNIPATARR
ncbi:hypothetical protein [Nonomuraea sp. NPDC049480]|uniref:hypothetical protein n=1 Tax=Nonomuraea sp. NPDC049480 TaxID=3364353 RepID=UPI0037AC5FB9